MSMILLVEDSVTETEVLTRYLQQGGWTVMSVKSVEEAQTKLSLNRPDLIVLDVVLPGQSGFELCRELKSSPTTVSIPVVLCSTKGTEADKIWGSMLGADAYLPKPVTQQDLLATVQRLVTQTKSMH